MDEMGTHTSLGLCMATHPEETEGVFKVPSNRGTTTSLLASMSSEGMGPSMAIEGSTTKEVFEAYVKHLLSGSGVEELKSGQLVLMDNLWS